MAYRNTYPILIIVGAGSYSAEVLDIALNSNEQPSILGFLDDNTDKVGCLGIDVLGRIDDYQDIVAEIQQHERFCRIVYTIAVHNPGLRYHIDKRMQKFGAQPYTLTHQSSIVSQFSEIGSGSVLGYGSVVGPNTTLSAHTHIGTHASVGANSYIGEFCTLESGVRVCGDAIVQDQVLLGSNCVVPSLRTVHGYSTISPGTIKF